MAMLIVTSEEQKGKRLVVLPKKDLVIGRDEDCQVRLAADNISPKHCVLRCKDEDLFVEDLGSRVGTLVNGNLVQSEILLKLGDSLQVGSLLLKVVEKKQEREPQVTEDNILDWLSKDAIGSKPGSEDAISMENSPEAVSQVEELGQAAHPETARVTPKRHFKSIAEEGADIIRRYLEMVDKKT